MRSIFALAILVTTACTRSLSSTHGSPTAGGAADTEALAPRDRAAPAAAPSDSAALHMTAKDAAATDPPRGDAAPKAGSTADAALGARDAVEVDGPHEIALEPGRPIYYAFARDGARPRRLVAHLHGMCGAPSYACGKWMKAAVETGTLICPTGNARCGDPSIGPPSWEASSWPELVRIIDQDLERSLAKVAAKHPDVFAREGAVLTGYSRGAYAAAVIARTRKDRWPYLVLVEADASLSASSLRAAGVRAVALVAGELGTEMRGARATADALTRDGFPAKLFVMKKTGHLYSDDVDDVMREALAFVLRH